MGEVSEATPKTNAQVWIQPVDVVQRWGQAGRQESDWEMTTPNPNLLKQVDYSGVSGVGQ